MKTWTELSTFARSLSDEPVLTVYIADQGTGDRERWAWRKRFAGAAADAQPEDTAEATEYEAALEQVKGALEPLERILPCPGWVLFAGADGVHHSGGLLHKPTEMVRWGHGPSLGPYLPSLARAQGLVVVLADERGARILTYEGGELEDTEELAAEALELDEVGPGSRKQAATATGVRGATRTDAARRSQAAATRRFLADVAERARDRAHRMGGGVAVGGAHRARETLVELLAEAGDIRVAELAGTAVDASGEPLLRAIDGAYRDVRRVGEDRLVAMALEGRRASAGWNAVMDGFRAGAVDKVLVAEGLLPERSDDVDELVAAALQTGATAHLVSGAAEARLTSESDGVAAILRFDPDQST